MGTDGLYLYTDSAESFYAARGWHAVLRETHDGGEKVVMAKRLGATTGTA